MSVHPPLAMIAAVARNGVIGAENTLPWRLPTDLRHFKATTLGKPVLMGRKTYQSIGRPLPGREVVVVTSDRGFAPDGVHVAHSLEEAIRVASACAERMDAEEIVVAGGGTLYASLIAMAARLYVTDVDLAPAGDTLFPPIDAAIWHEVSRITPPRSATDEAAVAFVVYERF